MPELSAAQLIFWALVCVAQALLHCAVCSAAAGQHEVIRPPASAACWTSQAATCTSWFNQQQCQQQQEPRQQLCQHASTASTPPPRPMRTPAQQPRLGPASVAQVDINGTTVHIGGMCKGSGMIHPNMATMLGVVTCDADVEPQLWRAMLRQATDDSFNAVRGAGVGLVSNPSRS